MKFNPESLYLKLPISCQSLFLSLEGYRIIKKRYSKQFYDFLKSSRDREVYTQNEIQNYQKDRLKKHFLAASKSKYWSSIFSKFNLDLEFNDPFKEIKKIPIMEKGIAKGYNSDIIPESIDKNKLHICHTSGTTGSGLNFWETREAENEQWAIWWRYRMRHAINLNTWCMYFGGRSVISVEQKKPPYWRVNYPGKQLFFSAYHLNEESVVHYVKKMRDSKFSWIHGYPSFIARLAQLKLEFDNRPLENVKWITTGAENLLEQQKSVIKEAFGVSPIQHYGLREAVANISECEFGSLHVDEDFSCVEFIPIENTEYFKIVGTNWSNPAFPLFRYDTGDICKLSNTNECLCNRKTRIVKEIDGRKEDFVILPNGCAVGRLDHIFKDLTNIREAQVLQVSKELLEFKIVPGSQYNKQIDEKKLLNEIQKRLGYEIKISIKYLNSIERTQSGKLRFVVSKLKEGQNI